MEELTHNERELVRNALGVCAALSLVPAMPTKSRELKENARLALEEWTRLSNYVDEKELAAKLGFKNAPG